MFQQFPRFSYEKRPLKRLKSDVNSFSTKMGLSSFSGQLQKPSPSSKWCHPLHIANQKNISSDARRAMQPSPPGTLKRMACCSARTTTGRRTAKPAKAALTSSPVLSCWPEITSFIPNASPARLAVASSAMAKVTLWLRDLSSTAGCATNGRHSSSSSSLPTIRLMGGSRTV